MTVKDVKALFGEERLLACRGLERGGSCRKNVITARNITNDKTVPLDPSAPLYLVRRLNDELVCAPLVQPIEDGSLIMVTHFATCKDANSFSKKRGT